MRALFLVGALLVTGIARGQGVTVSGTVRDSVAGAPLGGAIVQIVADSVNAMPRMATTDSLGRYKIEGVPRGRHIILFLHPLLDSLTLEPVLQSLEVGDRAIAFNLATPAGPRLRSVFCGTRGTNSGAALVGVVRDAIDGQPVAGATVTGEWLDLVIRRGSVMHQPARRTATSAANGWFALCGVPGPGAVSVQARRESDTTDRVEMSIPDGLFARRDLYVASSHSKGHLNGRVINEKGRPLSGAMVGLAHGAQTRSNAAGEWTLMELPLGTRSLEVRAIGYFPQRLSLDILQDPAFVRIQLARFEAMLDTMRIRATGMMAADEGGFDRRRRALGSGRFITEDDVRRRNPVETSDLLKAIPGLYVSNSIAMRNAFDSAQPGSQGGCVPDVFLDGHYMPPMGTLRRDDFDDWVRPNQIAGIEIYPDAVPPQFQLALSGCGSIVVWTKRGLMPRKK